MQLHEDLEIRVERAFRALLHDERAPVVKFSGKGCGWIFLIIKVYIFHRVVLVENDLPGVSREDAYTLLDERLSSVTQELFKELGEACVELKGVVHMCSL